MPPIFSRIPAARKPERTLAMVLPACQMAMRIGDSSMVYQHEVTLKTVRTKREESGKESCARDGLVLT